MLKTSAQFEISYYMEINRKLIHLSSLWMPLIIYYATKQAATIIFTTVLIGMLIYEYVRLQNTAFSQIIKKLTTHVLRAHETDKNKFQLTGASYVLIAALVSTLFFSKIIAITALSIMLISDTAAALIGRRYGTVGALGKSWIGSFAFLISGFMTIIIINQLLITPPSYLLYGLIAVSTAMFAELYSKYLKIDDNLSITLTAALTLWIFL